jgi:hypothetical protein
MCGGRKGIRKDKKRKDPRFLIRAIKNGEKERAVLLRRIKGGGLNPIKALSMKHRLGVVEVSICKFMNMTSPDFDELFF